MRQAVDRTSFEHRDYARFKRQLAGETALLHDLVERDALSRHAPVAGLDLEAWLIDAGGRPAPRNDEFITRIGSPDIVTELGRFKIELDVPPQPVSGGGLGRLSADLEATWGRCRVVAAERGCRWWRSASCRP